MSPRTTADVLPTFLYLILCSGRNRVRMQLRRLREPRYAVATVVGLLYFAFIAFRPRGRSGGATVLPGSREATELGAATVLFLVAAFAWIRPGSGRAALTFTRPDVQWLFTAPLTRRQLIEYVVLRSQLTAVFSAALLTMFIGPEGSAGRLRFFIGFWISSAIVSLHLSGVALSRASLTRHGIAGLSRQWLPVLLVAAAVATIAASVWADWPGIAGSGREETTTQGLHRVLSRGAAAAVLWPFHLLARLTLAPSLSASVAALPGALALLALNVLWVLRSDAAFEEASAERAEKVARLAAGRAAVQPRMPTRRSAPFVLTPLGRPETALLWKNLILLGRFPRATVMTLLVLVATLAVGVVAGSARDGEAAGAGFIVFAVLSVATVVMGPMMMRNDLRQDLAHIAQLKTWPVPGVSIVLGEMLAPAVVLSALACAAIATAVMLSGDSVARVLAGGGATRLTAATSAMLVAPALIFTQLVVFNGLAILFPAWMRIGASRAPGVEMMGQSMVMMIGVMFALGGALIPPILLAALTAYALLAAVGVAPIVVLAAVGAAALLGECLLIVVALGAALDRTDISAVDAAA